MGEIIVIGPVSQGRPTGQGHAPVRKGDLFLASPRRKGKLQIRKQELGSKQAGKGTEFVSG